MGLVIAIGFTSNSYGVKVLRAAQVHSPSIINQLLVGSKTCMCEEVARLADRGHYFREELLLHGPVYHKNHHTHHYTVGSYT